MKKLIILSTLALATIFIITAFKTQKQSSSQNVPAKFHELKVKTLDGTGVINFADLKGKKVLIVNTASECGFTPQYDQLQKLYERYKDKLVVIGFPCNQFGGQEPGDADYIQRFCSGRFGVTFPMAEKVDVKGNNQHVVYQWLTQKKFNKVEDINVRWNFGKFLIDENGKFIQYFPSQVSPLDDKITSLIGG